MNHQLSIFQDLGEYFNPQPKPQPKQEPEYTVVVGNVKDQCSYIIHKDAGIKVTVTSIDHIKLANFLCDALNSWK